MDDTTSVAPDRATDSRTNEELDQLADQTDVARNSERPMTSEKSSEPTKAPDTAKEAYEFIHNGKPVKGTREEILRWAQMGYDRPQFVQKFNQEKVKWEQEKAQYEQWKQKYAPYTQIDDWALKNPSQWQQLQDLWKKSMQNPAILQSQSGQNQNPSQGGQVSQEIQPYLSKIQNLEQQISQMLPAVQEFKDWRTQTTQEREDQQLDQEVKSIREHYTDLDWTNLDENGKSLEIRVLEHANQNGIKSFKTAFRDLLHDDLLNRAQAKAQQSVAKAVQTRTKLGILGESPMSQKGKETTNNRDIRKISYEDLAREGLEEELRRTS